MTTSSVVRTTNAASCNDVGWCDVVSTSISFLCFRFPYTIHNDKCRKNLTNHAALFKRYRIHCYNTQSNCNTSTMVAPTTTDEITLRVQQFYNDTFTKNERRTWIYGWFISGMLTILIPLIIFVTSRRVNTDEEDGGDANNNNNNNNEENNQSTSPWWFFGSNRGDDRRDEDRTPPILIASYLWSILVFHGILFYGYRAFRYSSSRSSSGQYDTIIVALVLFANYNILSLLLLSNIEGAIETEGPGVEEHGFVGQFGVMVRCILIVYCDLFQKPSTQVRFDLCVKCGLYHVPIHRCTLHRCCGSSSL